jgi:phage-related protein
MDGVTFGTKHSYKDFGLILSSKDISLPKAKTKTVEIPGADGVIDLTEILTDDVKYENRTLSFTFTVIDPMASWSAVLSTVTNYLHGKKMRIYMDWDRNYYYEGRCSVNQFKSSKRTATIVIDCDCDPYKIEKNSASDPWVWDTFSFVDGIIYINKVTVSGTKSVALINRRKIVSPTFICSAAMTVTFDGVTYNLSKGTTTVLDIRFQEGENIVVFKGNGTVQIDYKGGSL